jgi:hypothetical protein
MSFVKLASWLFIVAIALWIVLYWCGVAKEPASLLCFFTLMQFLILNSVPALPVRAG